MKSDMADQDNSASTEHVWLARILVVALLVWMPVQLLVGVIPAGSVYKFLSDSAFSNFAQAFGAIGTLLAIVGTAYFTRQQIRSASELTRLQIEAAAIQTQKQLDAAAELERKRMDGGRLSFFSHVNHVAGLAEDIERLVANMSAEQAHAGFKRERFDQALLELDELRVGLMTDSLIGRCGRTLRSLFAELLSETDSLHRIAREGPIQPHATERMRYLAQVIKDYRQQFRPNFEALLYGPGRSVETG